MSRLLTIKEAAALLNMNPKTLRENFRLLGMPFINLRIPGGKKNLFRFPEKDLEKWLERRKEGGYAYK